MSHPEGPLGPDVHRFEPTSLHKGPSSLPGVALPAAGASIPFSEAPSDLSGLRYAPNLSTEAEFQAFLDGTRMLPDRPETEEPPQGTS